MKSESGQTTIEYILLIAVVVSLIYALTNNPLFQDVLDSQGSVFTALKNKLQYGYRHGLAGSVGESFPVDYNSKNHPTYYQDGETRFFGPAEAYP